MQPHEFGYDSDFEEYLEEPEGHTNEPAEPATEPAEPSESSPSVNAYEELAGTSETHLWPNMSTLKPVPHRTMVQAMKASLQYLMLGTGGQNDSLHTLHPLALTAPTAHAAHPANPLLLTAAHQAAAVSPSLKHTAPTAHAAPARPRGHRGKPEEDYDEPP